MPTRWRRLLSVRLLNRYRRRRRFAEGKRQYRKRTRRLERKLDALVRGQSVPYIVMKLEGYAKRKPRELRGMDGRVLARAYLKAIEEGALDDATQIARILRERPPGHFSRVQERNFVQYLSRRLAQTVPSGTLALAAIEALEGLGYQLSPDVLVATALLTEKRTPANVSVSGDKALTDLHQRIHPERFRAWARMLKDNKRNRMIAAGRASSHTGRQAPVAGN